MKKCLALMLVVWVVFYPFIPSFAYATDATGSGSPLPADTLETGPAESISTSISEVNTVTIDSQIGVTTIQVPESTQIVIPFASTPAMSSSPSSTRTQVVETKNDQVAVSTTAEAIASSGNNEQNVASGSAKLDTGEAKALATAVSVVDTTLVDSEIQIGVVSVGQTWYGDIVIDPMSWEPMTSGLSTLNSANLGTQVVTVASASAQTGNNEQVASGSSTMTTGSASAISQANAIVNATLINADIFTFLPENIWLWSGNIRNWESPGSIVQGRAFSNMGYQDQSCNEASCLLNIATQNKQVQVETIAIANASTGNNTQYGNENVNMSTGNAYAGAVSTAIVNATLINSRYRQLSLLLFAPWVGDLVFAYPDLGIVVNAPTQVYEGEDIKYVVTTTNYGYALAKDVTLHVDVRGNESRFFEINESWKDQSAGAIISKIFTVPTSGKGGQTLTFKATINNDVVEESTQNNQIEQTTRVLAKADINQTTSSESDQQSNGTPRLRLSSQNNIHEFVYPGDQVTYDMKVGNDGSVDLKNIVLIQDFYSPEDEKISQFVGKIGDLAVNQRKSIHFVMKTSDKLSAGSYYTKSFAQGESNQGEDTSSNLVQNDIVLRTKGVVAVVSGSKNAVEVANALSPDQEKILGMALGPKSCGECLSFPWYIATSLGSLIYYLICRQRRDYARAMRYGIALPLSAYAGLIVSNLQCASGIVMLPSAGWQCEWFILIASLIYLVIMSIKPVVVWFFAKTARAIW